MTSRQWFNFSIQIMVHLFLKPQQDSQLPEDHPNSKSIRFETCDKAQRIRSRDTSKTTTPVRSAPSALRS